MRFEFSARGRQEYLTRLADLAEVDPEAAERFDDAIRVAREHLLAHPGSGRIVHLARGGGARRWNVPPMVLFYEVRGDVLRVLRIRHGAQRPIAR